MAKTEKVRPDITTVLFDLDGTLLPMDQEVFTKRYFTLLSQKAAEFGYDHKTIVDAVWGATKVMMKNDGSAMNIEVFWHAFQERLGEKALALKTHFDSFYAEEFHRAKDAAGQNTLARPLIDLLKKQGYTVAVATNPVFPQVANRSRLSWVGLSEEDFAWVTCYENARFCKPSTGYYSDILEKLEKTPGETIMIGNDMVEDMAAAKLGTDIFMVTDCLIDAPEADHAVKMGSFVELLDFFAD